MYYLGLLVVSSPKIVENIIKDDRPTMAHDIYLRQLVSIFFKRKCVCIIS